MYISFSKFFQYFIYFTGNLNALFDSKQYFDTIDQLQIAYRNGLGKPYATNEYVVQNFVDPTNINLKNVDLKSWKTFRKKLNESAPLWPIRKPSFKEMYVVRKDDGNWYRAKLKYPKKDSNEYVMVLVDTHEVVNVQTNRYFYSIFAF